MSHARTAYISTGDRDFKAEGLPVDSAATIEGLFSAFAEDYGVNRILWRGGYNDLIFGYYKAHKQIDHVMATGVEHIRWLRQEVGTSQLAIQAAHRRGMAIYLHSALFGHGGPPPSGWCEDPVRVDYPECVPVNRYGTRRQHNMVELCHHAARETLVRRYLEFVCQQDYDGIEFFTYTGGAHVRYMSEFGYNRPIVDAFKKRYGVDIRREPFDKTAWAKLRGKYLTVFLRDLHAELSQHGKKLMMLINPRGTHLPQDHGHVGDLDQSLTCFHMDWETWAREGIVDELSISSKNSPLDEIVRAKDEVLAGVAGTGCRVSVWLPPRDAYIESLKKGMDEVLTVYDKRFESGFGYEHLVGKRPVTTNIPDASVLNSPDVRAKRRLLYLMAAGEVPPDAESAIGALQDDDVFVRRRAIEALAATHSRSTVSHIEDALRDPEHSVRCKAATALGDLYGPDSAERIFAAIAWEDKSHAFIERCAVPSLCKMVVSFGEAIENKIVDSNERVRRAAIMVATAANGLPTDAGLDRLIQVVHRDPCALNRQLALSALLRRAESERARAAMLTALADQDERIQVRAAECVSAAYETQSSAPHSSTTGGSRTFGEEAVDRLVCLFDQYGEGSARFDAAYGWREVGHALLGCGDKGREPLDTMMRQRQDPVLAERAWRVLCLQELKPDRTYQISEEDDERAHALRPAQDFARM